MPVVAFCQTIAQFSPEWVNKMGSATGTVNATAIKADAAGNTYLTGNFTGTVDFDPSAAFQNLIAGPGNTAGFIAKYTPDGALVWAYSLLGSNVSPLDVSLSNNSISIIGKFDGTFDADPGLGVNTLSGSNDAFVIDLKNDGSFSWAKSIGGVGADIGNKIASDGAGNVYAALLFQSTVTVGGSNYTAKGLIDGMLIKYDAAGNVLFAIDLGYSGEQNTVEDVAVDNAGNIDIVGYLNGPVNFNPLGTAFAKSAMQSIYIAQYLPTGQLKWVNSVENGFQNNNNDLGITLTGTNDIYVIGSFGGTINFNLTSVLHAKGTKDFFVVNYSQAGVLGPYIDVGRTGGSVTPKDIGLSTDGKYLYVSGNFAGQIDFSTNLAPSIYASHGPQDFFLARYKTSGGALDALINAGNNNNACSSVSANGLAIVDNDKVMLTGNFCSTIAFGGTCTEYNTTASGGQDMFLAKYSLPPPITNNIIANAANCSGGPNVLTGSVPAGGIGTYRYEWQKSTDGINFDPMPGVTGQSYTPPVTGSDIYYLRMVISGECNKKSQSNPIAVGPSSGPVQDNIIDNPDVPEGCFTIATKVTGHLPTHGGGVYTYQWQRSADGINGWKDMVDLSGPSDTYKKKDIDNVSDNVTLYIRRLVSVPGCDPIPSNVVKLTVYPLLDHIQLHATGKTEFCDQGDPGMLVPDTEPTGGNGTYIYQWKRTTSTVYENVPDAEGGKNASITPGVLKQSTTFVRYVYSGPCFSGDPGMVSNPVIINIKKKIDIVNNIAAPNEGPLCRSNADPSKITGTAPSGGTGTFSIQWQRSTDNFNNSVENIDGANQNDYDPPVINQTTYYRRVVAFSGASECTLVPSISAVVMATVSTANVTNNNIHKSSLDPDLYCSTPAKPNKIVGDPAVGSGFTYQWQNSVDGGKTFQDITGATDKDFTPPELKVTTIYHRLAVVNDKCMAPLPSGDVAFNIASTASSNKITSPATTIFCDNGDADTINGSEITGGGTVLYQWQSSTDGGNTYQDISQANYSFYDPPASTSTIYYRRVVTTSVCSAPSVTEPVAIAVYKTPVVTTSANELYLCVGDKVVLTASGGAHYKWTPSTGLSADDVAAPTASPKTTTTYSVDVSNGGSCSAPGSVKVIVIPKPVVSAGDDRRVFRGESVKLNGKVTGDGVHYSWSPITDLDDPNSLTPTATPSKTTTYTLTATTDHGCSITTDEVTLNVFEKVIIPNAFTPNGDGKNDLWEIVGLSTYPGNVLQVFNRHGMEVFRTVSAAKTWDGNYQGKSLPFGTYYYVIDLKDGSKPLSGWVSLIR